MLSFQLMVSLRWRRNVVLAAVVVTQVITGGQMNVIVNLMKIHTRAPHVVQTQCATVHHLSLVQQSLTECSPIVYC